MTKEVVLKNGQTLLHKTNDKPLLDTLERLGHYAECRSGYCGACKVTLRKGEVRYHQTPMALLQQDEILPCVCSPVGDIELA